MSGTYFFHNNISDKDRGNLFYEGRWRSPLFSIFSLIFGSFEQIFDVTFKYSVADLNGALTWKKGHTYLVGEKDEDSIALAIRFRQNTENVFLNSLRETCQATTIDHLIDAKLLIVGSNAFRFFRKKSKIGTSLNTQIDVKIYELLPLKTKTYIVWSPLLLSNESILMDPSQYTMLHLFPNLISANDINEPDKNKHSIIMRSEFGIKENGSIGAYASDNIKDLYEKLLAKIHE